LEHDLVHEKPRKNARIGAPFGARQGNNLLAIRFRLISHVFESSLFLKGKYGALNGGIFGASSIETYIMKSTLFRSF
jgi:hypothetical protein